MTSSPECAHGQVLELQDVSFGYRERLVLDTVSLHVGAGEIVGVVGGNGAGKSTLVAIASGVRRRYAGTVRVLGVDLGMHSPRELARSVAVVPQETTFAFPFTALQVVLLGRHPHLSGLGFESPADIALAEEVLERLGAARLAHRSIHELSAGERQRIVFARALVQSPQLLLLDEATSFLDVRHQVELYTLVRNLATRDGVGVLAVLHDLNMAAQYCDRIYLLREGRVLAHGPTAEVFTYANLTKTFDTDIYVDINSVTGGLLVAPLPMGHLPP